MIKMDMNKETYKKLVDHQTKKSRTIKNSLCAFVVGGAICSIGEALKLLYNHLGMQENTVTALTVVTLIFIASLATALGLYDRLAVHAGAGTLVPITGFSNAVTAPAIDSKTEGYVVGVGGKMFVIAGPVIVYGVVASVIYGLVYYFFLR